MFSTYLLWACSNAAKLLASNGFRLVSGNVALNARHYAGVHVAIISEVAVHDFCLHQTTTHIDDAAVLQEPQVESYCAKELALTPTTRRFDDDSRELPRPNLAIRFANDGRKLYWESGLVRLVHRYRSLQIRGAQVFLSNRRL